MKPRTAFYGSAPWQQAHWDGRAALNFIGGGAGSAWIVSAAFSGAAPLAAQRWSMALGALLVMLGLASVWAEIGRPWRALNVLRQPRRSWMAREAWLAPFLIGVAAAVALGAVGLGMLAGLAGLAYLYCQARILQAARGVPAWREALTVPLVITTGLAEGFALFLLTAGPDGARAVTLAALLVLRFVIGAVWSRRLARVLGERPRAAVNRAGHVYNGGTLAALALLLVSAASPLPPAAAAALQLAAAVLALAGGALFKWQLVTRAAFNQGFSLPHLPVRGARRPASLSESR